MGGKHHVSKEHLACLSEHREALANAVPPNMVEEMRHMLASSVAAGMSEEDAYASAAEALRAFQSRLPPHGKAWRALESGCLWLERERARNYRSTV